MQRIPAAVRGPLPPDSPLTVSHPTNPDCVRGTCGHPAAHHTRNPTTRQPDLCSGSCSCAGYLPPINPAFLAPAA